jgi:hypothetical protein
MNKKTQNKIVVKGTKKTSTVLAKCTGVYY